MTSSRRRPWVAALLSLLTPGLGHLYAGSLREAVVVGVLIPLFGSVLAMVDFFLVRTALLFTLGFVALMLVMVPGVPIHAALRARRAGVEYELQRFNRFVVYAAFFLLVGQVWHRGLFWLVRGYFAEAFRIPSVAAEPTLLAGDYILVAKFPGSSRRPQHDSLVVFRSPEPSGIQVVKRVIGLPGDTLSMVDGVLRRNGQEVSEPYVQHADTAFPLSEQHLAQMRAWQTLHSVGRNIESYAPTARDWGPLTVPADSFFAIGDNRDESYDSRFYGFVPFENVYAQPRVIYFSYARDAGVRWRRIGQRIR